MLAMTRDATGSGRISGGCGRCATTVACLLRLALLGATTLAAPGLAQETPSAAAPTPTPAATPAPAPPGPTPPPEPWVKRLRSWAHRTVVDSAAWFDGLFGDLRADDDVYVSRAWLSGFVEWDEEEELHLAGRLRARYVFPQMERKLGLLVGRGDPDEMLSPTDPTGGGLNRLPPSERETLAGLEYVPLQGAGSKLSFSAGARIADPVDPYVRARFRHLFPFGDDALLRFRQTVFWRDSKGFGTTSSVDLERRRSDGFLLRWSASATVSEASEEVEYDTGVTVYHSLGRSSALAWHGWIEGDSGLPVPTSEYGADVAFRRRIGWPWLIGELRAGRAWRRDGLDEERHGVWLAGIGFEMQLGATP